MTLNQSYKANLPQFSQSLNSQSSMLPTGNRKQREKKEEIISKLQNNNKQKRIDIRACKREVLLTI